MYNIFSLRKYRNLNLITVSAKALKNNFKIISDYHPEASVCPVLKSNAYGHGIKIVAPVFDRLKPAFLIVDSLYEAYELYKLHLKSPVLIMGYTDPTNFRVKPLPFEYAVFDIDTASALNSYQPGAKIHLKVDTGMSRYGVRLEDFRAFVRQIKRLKNLKISGLASHFADADNPKNQIFVNKQILKFKEALKILTGEGINPKWRHISASAGSYKVKDPDFNLIRAGLSVYGISPLENNDPYAEKMKLTGALTFSSTITQVKRLEKGDRVGYNCTFTAQKPMIIAVIPAGYYEGIDRRLSDRGFVKVGKVYCPIIGRVSMNITAIDITKVKNARTGQNCEVFSPVMSDKNSIPVAASLAGTISYDLLVHLAESVKRELI